MWDEREKKEEKKKKKERGCSEACQHNKSCWAIANQERFPKKYNAEHGRTCKLNYSFFFFN